LIPKRILTITLIIIISIVSGYLVLHRKSSAKAENDLATAALVSSSSRGQISSNTPVSQEKAEVVILPVKAVPVRRGELIIKLKSPGEAFTDKKIALKAEVNGVVKNLYASEGRHVKEGDILLELEDREYRLRLEKQQTLRLKFLSELYLEKQFATADREITRASIDKLAKSEGDFKKGSEAFQKGLISQAEFEKIQKDYEIALIEAGRKKEEIIASSKGLTQQEIEVKIAQMELDKTKIRAPFAGIVTEIKICSAEHVDTGRELFTLVNISQIRIRARVLESEIGKIQIGRSADLRFSAYPGKVFKGVVEAISPIVNAEDKTCSAHIAVNNPAEEIKPGMHAEVEIASEIYKDRLLVPQEAILVRGGRKLVFVVESGLAKWRYITIGFENEDFAEILPGERPEESVKEGEMVITEGHFTLAHDARVVIKQ